MVRALVILSLVLGGVVRDGFAAARRPRWQTVWHASEALLAGAETADAASSWGKMEANPMVRAGPRFSYGSLAIKLGTLGWSLAAQHYILRRNREYMTALAMANIGVAGMLAGVAAHNMHVPAGR